MEENRGTGVTFGEICKAIKKRLWIVLIVTVAIAALAVLAAQFLYNPSGSTYSLTFTLFYPGKGTGKFPDGSPFHYRDIISLDMLTATKESDGRFEKIDVDKLLEKDGVTISESVSADGTPTGEYTLSVEAGYFSGRTAATDFLRALARRPLIEAVEKAGQVSYTLDESAFRNADYESRIELLTRQKEDILAQYDEWIALYRGNYAVAGKTLSNHRAAADVIFGEVVRTALLGELETNGYVLPDLIASQRAALEAEKQENQAMIEELKRALGEIPSTISLAAEIAVQPTGGSQPLDLSETLAALLVRNVQIDSQLKALTEENVGAFERQLDEIYEKLQDAAAKLQAVSNALYEQETSVYFSTSQAAREGGISLVLAAVGGLVIGFFLACIAVCLRELPRAEKQREEQNGAQGAQQPDGAAEEK